MEILVESYVVARLVSQLYQPSLKLKRRRMKNSSLREAATASGEGIQEFIANR